MNNLTFEDILRIHAELSAQTGKPSIFIPICDDLGNIIATREMRLEDYRPYPLDTEQADDENCTVTILDTQTGETIVSENRHVDFWQWHNGSCDCNRALAFGRDTNGNFCEGCHRYLIVACSSKKYTLDEMNEDYPEELRRKHLDMGRR